MGQDPVRHSQPPLGESPECSDPSESFCFVQPPRSLVWAATSSGFTSAARTANCPFPARLRSRPVCSSPGSTRTARLPISSSASARSRRRWSGIGTTAQGWDRYVIEKEFLTVEAGGAAYRHRWRWRPGHRVRRRLAGQSALVVGKSLSEFRSRTSPGSATSSRTAAPTSITTRFSPISREPGKPQLAFWNQKAKTLFLADIPPIRATPNRGRCRRSFSGAGRRGRGERGQVCRRDRRVRCRMAMAERTCWRAIIGSSTGAEQVPPHSRSARSAAASGRENSNPASTRRSSSRRATASVR